MLMAGSDAARRFIDAIGQAAGNGLATVARALDQADLAGEGVVAQADGAHAGWPGALCSGLRGKCHALPARHKQRHALQLVEFDHVVCGDALIAQGYEIKLTPPEPAAAFFRSEAARMAQVVKNANVKID